MNTELYLTPKELYIRTARKRKDAQKRVLISQGVDFTVNGDGEPLVLRSIIYRENGIKSNIEQITTPNVEALRALG